MPLVVLVQLMPKCIAKSLSDMYVGQASCIFFLSYLFCPVLLQVQMGSKKKKILQWKFLEGKSVCCNVEDFLVMFCSSGFWHHVVM
jgi:hypothetical protein